MRGENVLKTAKNNQIPHLNVIYTFKIRLRVQRNAPAAMLSNRKAKQWLTALRSFIKQFRSPPGKSLLTKNNTKNHPALHIRSGMICVTDEAEQGTAFIAFLS